jgi:hypothetical protein
VAILMFLAAAGAIVYALVRRRWEILILVLPAPLAFAVIGPKVTPYVDAKMISIAAPAVVAGAAVGLWLLGRRSAPVAAVVAAMFGAAILGSDALALHETSIAPTARMADLYDIGHRYAGRGLVDINEFEEFAKYFAREARVDVPTDSTSPKFIALRSGTEGPLAHSYDLDQQQLGFVESFPYVVLRRKPSASRPPANYRLDYVNNSYAVWVRTRTPRVVDHMPLGDVHHVSGDGQHSMAVPSCRIVRRFARSVPKGATLIAAGAPERAVLVPPNDLTFLSPGWKADPLYPGEVQLHTPGHAKGAVSVNGGHYDVWVRGSFGRPLTVRVNEHKTGAAQGINTPGGWLRAGSIDLPRGRATIEASRSGGRPIPGDGARSRWAGVALVASGAERLIRVDRANASALCGKPWDWIEAVRGG